MEFLENREDVRTVDADFRNKFKFEWLSDTDCNGDLYSAYLRKPRIPGKAFCAYCNDLVNYGSAGKRCLIDHAKTKKHASARDIIFPNQTLSATTQIGDQRKDNPRPNIKASSVSQSNVGIKAVTLKEPDIILDDRRVNAEATLLAFVSEHNLSLSMIPALIDFAREMAPHPSVLNTGEMSGSCGIHKMTDELAPGLRQKLVYDLQRCKFSINVGICASNANHRILTVLASYYSEEVERVVVQHYLSVETAFVNSHSAYQAVTEAFEKDEIPLTNLVSNLSDATGRLAGFDTLLRVKAPHLLDIGGDIVHDIHNIVKQFCSHFGGYMEELLDDIHVDLKFSPDLENNLEDICEALEVDFLKPKRRIARSCFSVYHCSLCLRQMLAPLSLLYWAWLPSNTHLVEMAKVYQDLLPVSEHSKKLIKNTLKDIHEKCRRKNMSIAEKERKERIVRKLLIIIRKTFLVLNTYTSCLKEFNAYVEVFQRNEPMVHELFDRQQNLLKWFLNCFLKSEEVQRKEGHLTEINVRDTTLHAPKEHVFMGYKTKEILMSFNPMNKLRTEFIKTLWQAYIHTAEYMQENLCRSEVVRQMSALDPKLHGYTATHGHLIDLMMQNFKDALSNEEREKYCREVRALQVNPNLPTVEKDMRVDDWWTLVFKTSKYPCLSKIIKMCLSIFTASRIDRCSSQTKDMIGTTATSMDVESFGALQTVRFYIKTKDVLEKSGSPLISSDRESASLRTLQMDNISPVDGVICSVNSCHQTGQGGRGGEEEKVPHEKSVALKRKTQETESRDKTYPVKREKNDEKDPDLEKTVSTDSDSQ